MRTAHRTNTEIEADGIRLLHPGLCSWKGCGGNERTLIVIDFKSRPNFFVRRPCDEIFPAHMRSIVAIRAWGLKMTIRAYDRSPNHFTSTTVGRRLSPPSFHSPNVSSLSPWSPQASGVPGRCRFRPLLATSFRRMPSLSFLRASPSRPQAESHLVAASSGLRHIPLTRETLVLMAPQGRTHRIQYESVQFSERIRRGFRV